VILLTIGVLAGLAGAVLPALAAYLLGISVLSAVTGWTRAARAQRTPGAGPGSDDILVTDRQTAG
jgi:hypothetical protein